jgi:hypothetical protein
MEAICKSRGSVFLIVILLLVFTNSTAIQIQVSASIVQESAFLNPFLLSQPLTHCLKRISLRYSASRTRKVRVD